MKGMRKKYFKRLVSTLIVLVMIVTSIQLMPSYALAGNTADTYVGKQVQILNEEASKDDDEVQTEDIVQESTDPEEQAGSSEIESTQGESTDSDESENLADGEQVKSPGIKSGSIGRATTTVNDFPALKSAVNSAVNDDVIIITNNITFTEVLTVTKNVTLQAVDGTILYAKPGSRHFTIGSTGGAAVTLMLNGIILDGKDADGYRNDVADVYYNGGIISKVDFTLVGGTIQNCGVRYGLFDENSSVNGGAIDAEQTLTVTRAKILNNYSDAYGGGIFARKSFSIDNSTIQGNEAGKSGGGIYATNAASITMTDAVEISGNKVNYAGEGGGIYMNGGSFIMKGGSINNNVGSYTVGSTIEPPFGGGVYIAGGATFTMSGISEICNNQAVGGIGGGVYIGNGKFYMKDTAKIGGNKAVKVEYTPAGGSSKWSDAHGGNVYMAVSVSLFSMKDNTENFDGTASSGGGMYLGAGTFTMEDDAKIYKCETEGDGGGVRMTGSAEFIMSGRAVIENCMITGNADELYGAGIMAASNSEFTMKEEATIQGCISGSYGGGIAVYDYAVFNMKGGVIHNNTAKRGGGVFVRTVGAPTGGRAAFNMSGGVISENTAGFGGGIYSHSNADVIMSGGSITGNQAKTIDGVEVASGSDQLLSGVGGGAFLHRGTLKMSGTAAITENSADISGGGIYVAYNGSFEMSSGEITDNIATSSHGGGMYVAANSTKVEIGKSTGTCKITGNTADTGDGGGIYTPDIPNYSKLDIGVKTTFADNAAVKLYHPPSDTSRWTNIAAASTTEYEHPLNNYDINSITYSITYKANGGIGDDYAVYLIPDEKHNILAMEDVEFTPQSGHEFIGWNTETDGSGTPYPIDEEISLSADLVLYAQWNPPIEMPSFTFTKVTAEGENLPLAGAEFKLYIWKGAGTPPEVVGNSSIAVGDKWVLEDTQTSEDDGQVTFLNLTTNAVYQLVETIAPTGYSRPIGQWRITVGESSVELPQAKGSPLPPAFYTEDEGLLLPNMKEKFFPFTGFGGIMNYLIFGSGIMILTVICFLLYKKRRINIRNY